VGTLPTHTIPTPPYTRRGPRWAGGAKKLLTWKVSRSHVIPCEKLFTLVETLCPVPCGHSATHGMPTYPQLESGRCVVPPRLEPVHRVCHCQCLFTLWTLTRVCCPTGAALVEATPKKVQLLGGAQVRTQDLSNHTVLYLPADRLSYRDLL
jgi:hypothetical protein